MEAEALCRARVGGLGVALSGVAAEPRPPLTNLLCAPILFLRRFVKFNPLGGWRDGIEPDSNLFVKEQPAPRLIKEGEILDSAKLAQISKLAQFIARGVEVQQVPVVLNEGS